MKIDKYIVQKFKQASWKAGVKFASIMFVIYSIYQIYILKTVPDSDFWIRNVLLWSFVGLTYSLIKPSHDARNR